ncbi:MAG: hypothetical protein M3N08_07905 [Pseudomonadota bacterium]|nr:hypothetical protein [Pseudomonadota bacterium]
MADEKKMNVLSTVAPITDPVDLVPIWGVSEGFSTGAVEAGKRHGSAPTSSQSRPVEPTDATWYGALGIQARSLKL